MTDPSQYQYPPAQPIPPAYPTPAYPTPAYPTPAYPTPAQPAPPVYPAPAFPSAPAAAPTPTEPAAAVPAQPTPGEVQQPTYPVPAPAAYPVPAPVGYPVSAPANYPGPAAPAPSSGGSPLQWVFLALAVVFLLATAGLGVAYAGASATVGARNEQISDLKGEVAARDQTIGEQQDQIAGLEDQADALAADAACGRAAVAFWLAPNDDYAEELDAFYAACHL